MTTLLNRPTDRATETPRQETTPELASSPAKPKYLDMRKARERWYKFNSYEMFDVWELLECWESTIESTIHFFATKSAARAALARYTDNGPFKYRLRIVETRCIPNQYIAVRGEVLGVTFRLDGQPGQRSFIRSVKRVRRDPAHGATVGEVRLGGRVVLVELDESDDDGDHWRAVSLVSGEDDASEAPGEQASGEKGGQSGL